MLIDFDLFNTIIPLAEESSRKRMHYDLRTSIEDPEWIDSSQRILNVMMPETKIPPHRHNDTSETVICLKGAVEEVFFNSEGSVLDRQILRYGSSCTAIQVPRGVYHTCYCIEPGSVIFEAKDRAYDPDLTEDLL